MEGFRLAFDRQIRKLNEPHADVAELAEALDSKSGVFGRGGSSPSIGTMVVNKIPTPGTLSGVGILHLGGVADEKPKTKRPGTFRFRAACEFATMAG